MRTIKFNNVYIDNYFTMISSKENNPIISSKVDLLLNNDYFVNKNTFEEGECEYQKIALDNNIDNPNLIYPGQKLVIK